MRLSCVERKNRERPQYRRDASHPINRFCKTSRHLLDIARFKGSEDDQIGTWLNAGLNPLPHQEGRLGPGHPQNRSLRTAQGRSQIVWDFDRAIPFTPRSGQQQSCACDGRSGNGDEEELERSGERTIFELVDSRKQRESDEADREYVGSGPLFSSRARDLRPQR